MTASALPKPSRRNSAWVSPYERSSPWSISDGTSSTCGFACAAGRASLSVFEDEQVKAGIFRILDKVCLPHAEVEWGVAPGDSYPVFDTKIGKVGAFAAANLVIGTKALDAADRLIYDKTSGNLFYDADGSGKGAAIRTALAAATGDYCLIQDADLEYEVSDYPALLGEVARGADVVYGSRFLANPRPTGMRTANYVANRMLTVTANLLYGMAITDEATCFKLFRTDLLRELGLTCTGFEFCPEVTAKLGRKKIKIVEVPIAYTARAIAETSA